MKGNLAELMAENRKLGEVRFLILAESHWTLRFLCGSSFHYRFRIEKHCFLSRRVLETSNSAEKIRV